jgi:hypothetical protein
MTKDEALAFDLALEALEETLKTLDDANAIPGGPIADTIWYSPYETLFDYLEVKIAAIKQARSAPVQKPVWIRPDELQKAQKAPFLCRVEPNKRDDFVPLYTTPPAAQPAYTKEDLDRAFSAGLVEGEKLAFESPAAQRQWVGLTEQEIKAIWYDAETGGAMLLRFAEAIEAKLKELNT